MDTNKIADRPVCELTGQDGNVFNVIAQVKRALKSAGEYARAEEFGKRALRAGSYAAVFAISAEYVEIR